MNSSLSSEITNIYGSDSSCGEFSNTIKPFAISDLQWPGVRLQIGEMWCSPRLHPRPIIIFNLYK